MYNAAAHGHKLVPATGQKGILLFGRIGQSGGHTALINELAFMPRRCIVEQVWQALVSHPLFISQEALHSSKCVHTHVICLDGADSAVHALYSLERAAPQGA